MPGFVTFLFIAGIGAFVGSRYKPDAWSTHLRQPPWAPSADWAFAPVRAFLSLINAFAGWLVWWANADAFSVPLIFWVAQVVLNACWSWLYFGRHSIFGALIIRLLLLLAVLLFIATAHLYSPAASWLFVPYALWLGFATMLNASIWHLNEGDESASGTTMLKALMGRVMRSKPWTHGR